MQVSAKLRHLHIAPRKVRLIADLVRGKSVKDARAILDFTTKKAADPVLKLLNSASANAKNNFQLDPANLYILKITVDEGPKLKRFMPRARGSANEIQKKTSHINIVLEEITRSGSKKGVKETAKIEAAEMQITEKAERVRHPERPKFKTDAIVQKPKSERGLKRIFRRQVF